MVKAYTLTNEEDFALRMLKGVGVVSLAVATGAGLAVGTDYLAPLVKNHDAFQGQATQSFVRTKSQTVETYFAGQTIGTKETKKGEVRNIKDGVRLQADFKDNSVCAFREVRIEGDSRKIEDNRLGCMPVSLAQVQYSAQMQHMIKVLNQATAEHPAPNLF